MSNNINSKPLLVLRYAIVIFAFASLVLFYYQCVRNINKFAIIDLTSYIRASEWFFDGDNPYQAATRRFIYPLFLLIVVYPFQWLVSSPTTKAITAAIWSTGLYLSFFLTVSYIWKLLYGYRTLLEALKKNILPLSVLVVMVHPSLQDEFLNGQVNLLVMGATAGFFFCLDKGRMFWAALFLAMATSVKIAPALCLLYLFVTRQYRAVWYFIPLLFLFMLGIPYLINGHSYDYYRYFVTDVMPTITGSDFKGGFRSFSVISTLSYVFGIHWYPPLKIAAVGILALGLSGPVLFYARQSFQQQEKVYHLATFGALITVLPLTFPMSEAHHLLLQIIPFLVIIAYWRRLIENGGNPLIDKLSLLFIFSVISLHVGHGLKDTPLRLLGLISAYWGMLLLMKSLRLQPKLTKDI